MEDVERLLALLGKVTPVGEAEDNLRWTVTQGGCFAVKSLYMALKPHLIESFSWQLVWRSSGNLRCSFSHGK